PFRSVVKLPSPKAPNRAKCSDCVAKASKGYAQVILAIYTAISRWKHPCGCLKSKSACCANSNRHCMRGATSIHRKASHGQIRSNAFSRPEARIKRASRAVLRLGPTHDIYGKTNSHEVGGLNKRWLALAIAFFMALRSASKGLAYRALLVCASPARPGPTSPARLWSLSVCLGQPPKQCSRYQNACTF